jgi:hypothetical protein
MLLPEQEGEIEASMTSGSKRAAPFCIVKLA